MSDALYDTCVFIDYWRGDANAFSLIDDVRRGLKTASYCTISATELWQYRLLTRKEEIEYIALTKYFLEEAPLTGNAAVKAGQWLRSFSRNRRRRLCADALISATAEERGEEVVTRNYKEIRRFYSKYRVY